MDDENQDFFITSICVKKVRHLVNLTIPLSEIERKHLLLTGKNGSGKTSLLDVLAKYLDIVSDYNPNEDVLHVSKEVLGGAVKGALSRTVSAYDNGARAVSEMLSARRSREDSLNALGISASFSPKRGSLSRCFQGGEFVLSYFDARRHFQVDISNHIEKVNLDRTYPISSKPGKLFVKYLVDKRVSQSLYETKGEKERAESIRKWFLDFEGLLREIYEDPCLKLDFDVDTFSFRILPTGREPFSFNEMSDGYSAILDIVVGLILRMEKMQKGQFSFTLPGIVLIDEIETHLHYALQKKVLPFLTTLFPNIQFIVSTHSAFVLNSIPNAVIFDLEQRTLVENGLSDYPYDGIINGYFEVSTLSKSLKEKLEQYRLLTQKAELSDAELAEVSRLETALEELPDYLTPEISAEFHRLQLAFQSREDL